MKKTLRNRLRLGVIPFLLLLTVQWVSAVGVQAGESPKAEVGHVEGFAPGMMLSEAEGVLQFGLRGGLYKPLRVWAQDFSGRPRVRTETLFTPFMEAQLYDCSGSLLRENVPVQFSMVFGSATAKAIQLKSYQGRLIEIAMDPLASYVTLREALEKKYGERRGWGTVLWETSNVRIYLKERTLSMMVDYSLSPSEPLFDEQRIEFVLRYEYRLLAEAMTGVLRGKCEQGQRKQKMLPRGY